MRDSMFLCGENSVSLSSYVEVPYVDPNSAPPGYLVPVPSCLSLLELILLILLCIKKVISPILPMLSGNTMHYTILVSVVVESI